MKPIIALFIIIYAQIFVRGDVLPNSLSPDGRIDVEGPFGKLFFVDTSTGKKLSPLFDKPENGQIPNFYFHVSWSPDSKTVAMLVDYGTRLSEILVYVVENGTVRSIRFKEPDIFSIFQGRLDSPDQPGYDDNTVGPWINKNTLRLTYGEVTFVGGKTRHFKVPGILTFSDDVATVEVKPAKVYTTNGEDGM